MSAHIIGRPNGGLLDIILGEGADPEQAIIRSSEQGPEEGDGFEEHLPGEEALGASTGVWIGRR